MVDAVVGDEAEEDEEGESEDEARDGEPTRTVFVGEGT